jgi:hypothetical protein
MTTLSTDNLQGRVRRELDSFKAMFEELGQLASRGQIVTVN